MKRRTVALTHEDGSISVCRKGGRQLVSVSAVSVVFDPETVVEFHGDWAKLSAPWTTGSVTLGVESKAEVSGEPVDLWGAVVALHRSRQRDTSLLD